MYDKYPRFIGWIGWLMLTVGMLFGDMDIHARGVQLLAAMVVLSFCFDSLCTLVAEIHKELVEARKDREQSSNRRSTNVV